MNSKILSALLWLLIAFPTRAEHSPLILPAAIEWTMSTEVEGKQRQFKLPKERAKINALPERERLSLLDRVQRVERNQAVARKTGQSFFEHTQGTPYQLTPDYERNLSEVAISVSYADADAENPIYRHLPILRALPDYSRIHILSPTMAETAIQRALGAERMLARAQIHPSNAWDGKKRDTTRYSRSTRWIRDMFLVARTRENVSAIYLPLAYAYVSDLQKSDLNFIRERWHMEQLVISVPAFVRGGNVAVADNRVGQRMAFVGSDEIEQNEAHYLHATGTTPPRVIVPEVIKRLAGSKEVLVLPNSKKLFHLDMAMSFLAPGLAAIATPSDESSVGADELRVLGSLRKALPASGFKVVNIPTTAARINAFQSSFNILPFIDKTTRKRRAIVPLFPDATITIDGRRQSLNEAIKSAYEAAGIEVLWAEDRFSDRWGNVHCTIIGLH